ncbi:MAG TPA: glutathione transferase GstA [Rhodanobacteraceae bacterium]|nr:glutathione transferase GstA [Rhodanobacteraceae bacterium]
MKLYYSPGACSLAPHIVAREAGIPIELVPVDLATHRIKGGGDYFSVNPRGYVPALELDDGTVLTEVAALVQYLADLKPASGLAPKAGTMERVELQMWLTFISSELHKQFSPWLWHADTAESTVRTIKDKIATRFAELDRKLATQPYLLGDRFSVADAYAFAIVNWVNFLKMDLDGYPALAAYLARIAARPKVQEALAAERPKREAA